MNKSLHGIKLLSSELIHRIAAGEVIDRPASALKELLENSVDAGATRVKVQLVEGGLQSFQVEDDGCGFFRNDLLAVAQRHATSKISNLDDLDQIYTLGFRGEALAAVSSVSKLTIDTFSTEEQKSLCLNIIGGVKDKIVPGRKKMGTSIVVEDLFFNIPARKKFLKRPATEAQECLEVLKNFALAQCDMDVEWFFSDTRGEVTEHSKFLKASFLDRFMQVVGVKAQPLFVEQENPCPEVLLAKVAILLAPAASRNQKSVHLTVNGRSLTDKRLPFSLREAFTGLIEVGAFPYAHVWLRVDPALMDVNVHPQKKEVRWPSSFSPASLAFKLVRPLLDVGSVANYTAPMEQAPLDLSGSTVDFVPSATKASKATGLEFAAQEVPAQWQSPPSLSGTFSFRGPQPTQWMEPKPPFKFSSLRVIGEFQAAYLLCESEDALVLIDQHAAHERVNYEKILKKRQGLFRSRPLLIPLRVKLPSFFGEQEQRLFESVVEAMGFEVSDLPSEKKSIEFVAVPDVDRRVDWSELFNSIFEDILSGHDLQNFKLKVEQKIAASLACHASIKQGQRLKTDQIQALLIQLDALEWGGLCPHGRPIWVMLKRAELERFFHRA